MALFTGLTGAGHRSDRCSTGSKPCKFQLCVLVCFGSEGCLLVPRSSGYVGLANLGSESETCVGSRVRLVGVSISFKKNFYRLPFTPPFSGLPYRSFKWYQSRFRSLLTLTSLRSKDGVPGTGYGSSTLRWQELPDVE
jgi:hypothetical protein